MLMSTESFSIRAVNGVSSLVLLDLDLERFVLGAVLPSRGELIRGSGDLILEARTDDTLLG
jgi:hypothetical protein